MSGLYQVLFQQIEKYISEYTTQISSKYDIPKEELLDIWSQNVDKKSLPINIELHKPSELDLSLETISRYTKKELEGVCKRLGLKVTGKKEDLLARVIQHTNQPKNNNSETKDEKVVENKVENKVETKKKSSPPKKKNIKEAAVMKKIGESDIIPQYTIKRNKWNNYEHEETKLVFDRESKKAYATQQDDGNLCDLTQEDIENCKKYKFEYVLPENLNKNSKNLNDVKVDEVDEEIEEDQVEEMGDDEMEEIEEIEEEDN